MEKAVETVYCNTVSDLGLSDATRPFFALILWEIQQQLEWASIDTTIYCLNRLHEIAPTGFDKARLLLLSQSDCICRDDYVYGPGENSIVILYATDMLQAERNGQQKEAGKLLRHLRNTGRFIMLLGEPDRIEEDSPTSVSDSTEVSDDCLVIENPSAFGNDSSWTLATAEKRDSERQSGGSPIPVSEKTADKPSWFRRLFMSWFPAPSVCVKGRGSVRDLYAPSSVPVRQGGRVVFPWDVGGSDGFSDAPPSVCDRPPTARPVVDINWFK
jgi:hypothetical protein